MELLRSRLLPIPHGFPTREGGVSQGAWASLNLGFQVGDDPRAVEENVRRLAAAGGFVPGALHLVSQVHGAAVVEAPAQGGAGGSLRPPFAEADAIVTAEPGAVLGIRVADCVPLLIADPVGERIAAVHSGWKGTDARIAARAVEALVARGSDAGDLIAALGPHIQGCCYEVSAELADRFERQFGAGAVDRGRERPCLNLAHAITRTLVEAGVPEAQVDVLPQCTSCDPRFFSHRRDRGATGRHLAFAICSFHPSSVVDG